VSEHRSSVRFKFRVEFVLLSRHTASLLNLALNVSCCSTARSSCTVSVTDNERISLSLKGDGRIGYSLGLFRLGPASALNTAVIVKDRYPSGTWKALSRRKRRRLSLGSVKAPNATLHSTRSMSMFTSTRRIDVPERTPSTLVRVRHCRGPAASIGQWVPSGY
jgi:hypothetical protein